MELSNLIPNIITRKKQNSAFSYFPICSHFLPSNRSVAILDSRCAFTLKESERRADLYFETDNWSSRVVIPSNIWFDRKEALEYKTLASAKSIKDICLILTSTSSKSTVENSKVELCI